MKKLIAVTTLLAGTVLAGCQSAPQAPPEPTAQKVVYSGMLPCADCSGIRTTLTLYRDQYDHPTRFELREEYMSGSKVALSAIERGQWAARDKVESNTQYQIFTINPDDPGATRQYVKDAVNAIEMLDKNGDRIQSNMNYRLLKK